ncbi:NTP transferase domain-containing protein [uncultured Ruminococcus sp.]|uniref:NTP transferase domain-containing protein n=1 Tax=uncultured Ruminococcus sp. TaxID=165186 RepID=UPI0025DBBE32|nr:NTP transferase domain-containing protein [uncultured Ruminococcus sp.]
MNSVNRAIIMAAGKGTRMLPLTERIPKPLVEVNGKSFIERTIEILLSKSISEIYVVTGYLKEKFKYLEEKYPEVTLLDNPYYDTCNNISSLYIARDYIENSVILDGDMIINNSDVIQKEFDCSGYVSIWTDKYTDEWLQQADDDNIVISCSRNGGKKGWILYSISYWSECDGIKLRDHLINEFEVRKNKDIYWDDVAMFIYPDEYKLKIRPADKGDIIEIDSLQELALFDKKYICYLGEKNGKD